MPPGPFSAISGSRPDSVGAGTFFLHLRATWRSPTIFFLTTSINYIFFFTKVWGGHGPRGPPGYATGNIRNGVTVILELYNNQPHDSRVTLIWNAMNNDPAGYMEQSLVA